MTGWKKQALAASFAVAASVALTACAGGPSASAKSDKDFLATYADIAYVNYSDALSDAKAISA